MNVFSMGEGKNIKAGEVGINVFSKEAKNIKENIKHTISIAM